MQISSSDFVPLRELLKDDALWCWNAVQDEAFQQIKMIMTTPVLAYYCICKDGGISGCVLIWHRNCAFAGARGRTSGTDHVRTYAYASRSLSEDEQRFPQIEKEALSIVWACEKLQCYVFGTEESFLIETDHMHRHLESIMNRQSIDEWSTKIDAAQLSFGIGFELNMFQARSWWTLPSSSCLPVQIKFSWS